MTDLKLHIASWDYDPCRALVDATVKGFCEAKRAAEENYKHGLMFNNIGTMFPWFSKLIEEDIDALGKDWWPYGIAVNRKVLDTVLRYHYEQGITDRLFTLEDIFVPELLTT